MKIENRKKRMKQTNKYVNQYFKYKKNLKKAVEFSLNHNKCLLCSTDVRILDTIYNNYSELSVFDNLIYICQDCLNRFKEVRK